MKPYSDLSPREFEVLGLLMQGKSSKVIARELDVAEVTVKVHRSRIVQKLGVRDSFAAMAKVMRDYLELKTGSQLCLENLRDAGK